MNRYDRNKSQRQTKAPIVLLIILIFGSWIYNLYSDIGWIKSEILIYKGVIESKDDQITSLIKIVDSLTYKPKNIIIHDEPKPKFIKKQDTLTKKTPTDTNLRIRANKILSDSVKK